MISNQTIVAKDISKSFGYLPVFKKISFKLKTNNCYLLKGDNGQGKSTLLKILAGLYSLDAGSLSWCGQKLHSCLQAYRKQLFLLSHDLSLYENFSPLENIAFFSSFYAKKRTAAQIFLVLEELRLQQFAKIAIKNFSQGMKKKVLLALMVLIEPKTLLLDEPYSDLDQAGIRFLNDNLTKFINKNGCLVLMTSHQTECCDDLNYKILKLENQKITFL